MALCYGYEAAKMILRPAPDHEVRNVIETTAGIKGDMRFLKEFWAERADALNALRDMVFHVPGRDRQLSHKKNTFWDVMYRNAGAPARMLRKADVGRFVFVDDIYQVWVQDLLGIRLTNERSVAPFYRFLSALDRVGVKLLGRLLDVREVELREAPPDALRKRTIV